MSVIELGDVTTAPAGEPGDPPFDRRVLVRLAAAVIAGLCVLGVTGSARPEPTMLRVLWSIPYSPNGADALLLAGDTAFVLSNGRDSTVTAYRLADGRTRWTRTLDDPALWMTAARQPGVLLLPTGQRFVSYVNEAGVRIQQGITEATIALDGRTGAQLWRLPGDASDTVADTVTMVDWDAELARMSTLSQVRARDGAVIWRHSLTDVEYHTVSHGTDLDTGRVVTSTADGRVDVLRLIDGTPVISGRVPVLPSSEPYVNSTDIVVDGGDLYVNRVSPNRITADAYRLDTLTSRWHVTVAAGGSGLYGCGSVLCRSDGRSTDGYSPATGAPLWSAPDWANASTISDDRLLADSGNGLNRGLLDAATGRVVADLGEATAVYDYTSPGSVFLLSPGRSDATHLSVSRLDARTGEVALRGSIGRLRDPGCQVTGDWLACMTMTGRLEVIAVG